MIDEGLIAARFGLYAVLAATAGLPLFWWAMGVQVTPERRILLAALTVGSGALSLLWLFASVAAMAGSPMLQPDWSIVDALLTETPLGTVMAVRLAALLLILLLLFRRSGRGWAATVALPAAIAAATLAWSGHAAASEGMAGSIHRFADAIHVIAAAGWFGALLALLHAAFRQAGNVGETQHLARMLARFSLFGSLFVGALLVTGLVNIVMIVGLSALPQLTYSLYGLLLIAKLVLFGVMLLLAAANRWRFTSALEAAQGAAGLAIARRHLRLSLLLETGALLVILVLVSALGTLDPLAMP